MAGTFPSIYPRDRGEASHRTHPLHPPPLHQPPPLPTPPPQSSSNFQSILPTHHWNEAANLHPPHSVKPSPLHPPLPYPLHHQYFPPRHYPPPHYPLPHYSAPYYPQQDSNPFQYRPNLTGADMESQKYGSDSKFSVSQQVYSWPSQQPPSHTSYVNPPFLSTRHWNEAAFFPPNHSIERARLHSISHYDPPPHSHHQFAPDTTPYRLQFTSPLQSSRTYSYEDRNPSSLHSTSQSLYFHPTSKHRWNDTQPYPPPHRPSYYPGTISPPSINDVAHPPHHSENDFFRPHHSQNDFSRPSHPSEDNFSRHSHHSEKSFRHFSHHFENDPSRPYPPPYHSPLQTHSPYRCTQNNSYHPPPIDCSPPHQSSSLNFPPSFVNQEGETLASFSPERVDVHPLDYYTASERSTCIPQPPTCSESLFTGADENVLGEEIETPCPPVVVNGGDSTVDEKVPVRPSRDLSEYLEVAQEDNVYKPKKCGIDDGDEIDEEKPVVSLDLVMCEPLDAGFSVDGNGDGIIEQTATTVLLGKSQVSRKSSQSLLEVYEKTGTDSRIWNKSQVQPTPPPQTLLQYSPPFMPIVPHFHQDEPFNWVCMSDRPPPPGSFGWILNRPSTTFDKKNDDVDVTESEDSSDKIFGEVVEKDALSEKGRPRQRQTLKPRPPDMRGFYVKSRTSKSGSKDGARPGSRELFTMPISPRSGPSLQPVSLSPSPPPSSSSTSSPLLDRYDILKNTVGPALLRDSLRPLSSQPLICQSAKQLTVGFDVDKIVFMTESVSFPPPMARGMDGTPKVVDSAMQSQDQIHTSKNSAGLAANSTNQFRTPAVSSYAPPPSPSFYSISKALSPVPPLPLPRFSCITKSPKKLSNDDSAAREITIHRRSAKINLSLLKAKRPKNDSGHELGFLQETGIERARAGTASLSIGKLLMNLCHIPLPTPLPSPALMNRPLVVPSVQHTPREQKNHVQISKEIYQTPRLLIPQRVHSPPLVQSIKLGYFSAPTQTSSIATPPAQALEHILSTPPSEVPQLGCLNSPAQRVARTKQDLIPVKEFREDNASSGSEDEEEMMLWESVIMERWLIKRQAEEEAVLETRKESECAGRCVSGLLGM